MTFQLSESLMLQKRDDLNRKNCVLVARYVTSVSIARVLTLARVSGERFYSHCFVIINWAACDEHFALNVGVIIMLLFV